MVIMKDKISWQDKRVAAITRWSKKRGIPCSDNNPYFDEYCDIIHSKANNKKEYKSMIQTVMDTEVKPYKGTKLH